jgi:hypothetical protein
VDARILISNNWGGGKSKTAERQKESVRDRALLEEGDSIGNKKDL